MLKIDIHAHYLPRDWPDLAAKYGDARFPVIHHGDDGHHLIYKDGKFFREIWAKTWLAKNPDFRYEVLTDQNDLAYVETNFGPNGLNRLDIVYMYRELTARIIKADLLRYLVMYIEGGIYTDIDVEALKPIKSFIPERWNERDVDMIVGIEVDQPEFHNHSVLGTKCMSFCQWTFMCKPRQQVM